ncbi:transglutaminase-like cysteine peptidase [candidate division KSB1 bacterium]|nr:transglutaminase-like cysteine peptidase [candidate division KSB1 bacterium]
MKKTNTIIIAVLTAIFMLSSSGVSQVAIVPDKIAAFNALLRDLDLNEETQNGYAITEAEYEQLKTAWKGLPHLDKLQLLHGSGCMFWTGTFVMALLYDLNNDMDREAHINNLAGYGRAQGLSLTLSRYNSPVTLTTARKTLADLLHKGSSMFGDSGLRITEEIKTQANERAGHEARQRLEKWEQLINDYQNRSNMDKLKAVNEFFNRHIIARADKGTEKGYDYWQSPIETLVRGIGDCDDFAMAKYVSLRLLGIPPEQLRVAVVEYPLIGGHAVLLFFPPNEKDPWVLDNLTFKYNGLTDSHVLRLSERVIRHKIKPLGGINENCLTEFRGGLNEKVTSTDPRHSSHKFGTALMNSQRVLPQTRG